MLRASLDLSMNPWKAADPNPMPWFDWWPWIDEVLALRSEIPARVRGALAVLRYGETDNGSDW